MNIATALKSEISRVARKEIRGEAQPLKKASSQHRTDIAALKRRVSELERLVSRLSKGVGSDKPAPDVIAGDTKLRFQARGFASLRKKLGLSAGEMALLLGVSDQSVYKWEQGKAQPRASQLPAIAAARKMGKKGAAAKLAELNI
jgi:DNA-binding XRE family transcriptional regulator